MVDMDQQNASQMDFHYDADAKLDLNDEAGAKAEPKKNLHSFLDKMKKNQAGNDNLTA